MRLEVGDYVIIAVLFGVALTVFTPFGYDFIKSSKGENMILMENTVDLINRYNSLLSQNKEQEKKIEHLEGYLLKQPYYEDYKDVKNDLSLVIVIGFFIIIISNFIWVWVCIWKMEKKNDEIFDLENKILDLKENTEGKIENKKKQKS